MYQRVGILLHDTSRTLQTHRIQLRKVQHWLTVYGIQTYYMEWNELYQPKKKKNKLDLSWWYIMPRSQLIKLEKSFWALIFIITSKLHAISCLMSDNNQQDKTTEQHRPCLNMLKCTHSLLTKKKKKKISWLHNRHEEDKMHFTHIQTRPQQRQIPRDVPPRHGGHRPITVYTKQLRVKGCSIVY